MRFALNLRKRENSAGDPRKMRNIDLSRVRLFPEEHRLPREGVIGPEPAQEIIWLVQWRASILFNADHEKIHIPCRIRK
jgi:hypothetical protein